MVAGGCGADQIGLLMVVAMIARAAPEAIVNNAKALAAPKYSNSYRMPYLMWLYGQVGTGGGLHFCRHPPAPCGLRKQRWQHRWSAATARLPRA